MECSDIRVAVKRFRVAAEKICVEVWKYSDGAVASSSAHDRLHLRIGPYLGEIVRALAIFMLGEEACTTDVGLKNDFVTGLFHCFRPTQQPPAVRCVGRRDD